MKLKIICAIIALSIFSSALLSGCGKGDSKILKNNQSSVVETVNSEVKYSGNFEEYIGKLIKLEEYDKTESAYVLKKPAKLENIDKTITFGDKSTINIPTNTQELEKAGWTDTVGAKTKIDENSSFTLTMQNSDKKQIYATAYNISVGKASPSEAATSDCEILSVMIPLTSYDNDGAKTGIAKNKAAPDFSLNSGITQDSSIPDVIEALGNPTKIVVSEFGALYFVSIYYINGSAENTEKECFRFWFNSKNECELRDFSITIGTE